MHPILVETPQRRSLIVFVRDTNRTKLGLWLDNRAFSRQQVQTQDFRLHPSCLQLLGEQTRFFVLRFHVNFRHCLGHQVARPAGRAMKGRSVTMAQLWPQKAAFETGMLEVSASELSCMSMCGHVSCQEYPLLSRLFAGR